LRNTIRGDAPPSSYNRLYKLNTIIGSDLTCFDGRVSLADAEGSKFPKKTRFDYRIADTKEDIVKKIGASPSNGGCTRTLLVHKGPLLGIDFNPLLRYSYYV